jgi:hypothetical protein
MEPCNMVFNVLQKEHEASHVLQLMFCGGVPSLKLRPFPWENQDQPLAYLSALSRNNTFLYLYNSKRQKMKTRKTLQQNSDISTGLHCQVPDRAQWGVFASCQLDLYIDMCNVNVGGGTWFKSSINIRCTFRSAPVWASNGAVAMASISSMKMMAGAFSFASRNTSHTIHGPCTCNQKWVLCAWINLFLEP